MPHGLGVTFVAIHAEASLAGGLLFEVGFVNCASRSVSRIEKDRRWFGGDAGQMLRERQAERQKRGDLAQKDRLGFVDLMVCEII